MYTYSKLSAIKSSIIESCIKFLLCVTEHRTKVSKLKVSKYSEEYLNFQFSSANINHEEQPLCVNYSKNLPHGTDQIETVLRKVS